MNLKQAQYILTILEEGSIIKAAQKLFVTQPALSQLLKNAESEIGNRIFVRGSTPLQLTQAGETYAAYARKLVLLDKSLSNEMTDINDERAGAFRFGIPRGVAGNLLLNIVPLYVQRYPRVDLRITEIGSTAIENKLLNGALDVGLIRAGAVSPDLNAVLVKEDHLVLLTGIDSPFAHTHEHETNVRFSETSQELFITKPKGNRSRFIFDQLCNSCQIFPKILFEFDQYYAAAQMAITCNCLMLTTSTLFEDYPQLNTQARRYEISDISMRHDTYVCWPKELHLTRYMRDWISLVQEFYEKRP